MNTQASLGTNGFFDLAQDSPKKLDFSMGLCCVTVTLDPLKNTKMTKMGRQVATLVLQEKATSYLLPAWKPLNRVSLIFSCGCGTFHFQSSFSGPPL